MRKQGGVIDIARGSSLKRKLITSDECPHLMPVITNKGDISRFSEVSHLILVTWYEFPRERGQTRDLCVPNRQPGDFVSAGSPLGACQKELEKLEISEVARNGRGRRISPDGPRDLVPLLESAKNYII